MRTFGTISWDAKGTVPRWKIEALPHVVLRLKRVFPKIGRRNHGKLYVTDTREVCRELVWFCERYPLDLTDQDRARLEARAAEHKRGEDAVAEILSGTYTPRDVELAIPPRRYQLEAADLAMATHGLLLADDVGLGKTCSALCLLADKNTRPALVVTLAHLPRQWESEIRRFLPGLRVHILRKGTPYPLLRKSRQLDLIPDELPDVIISTYHKLNGWAETLGGVCKTVVYDEVQELRKGSDSLKGAAAYHISEQADYRMGLSATPIYNYGGEIHAVLQAIRPHALGTWTEFSEEWCSDAGERRTAQIKEPEAFGTYLRQTGLMLRRTRKDVGRELPELTRVPHHVDCDRQALDDVASSAGELARIILGETDVARGESFSASGQLDGLVRQATGLAKAPYVADFVRLLLESEERVVLYGWHRAVYDLWLDRLSDLRPVLYTGSESATAKDKARQAFINGDSRLLIMSLRSGAGLDGLQGVCRTVVFGELDWSPGVHEQCVGRVHRDGQGEQVVAYYLISEEGSDPIVADVLGVKRAQVDGLRDPDGAFIEKLDASGDHVRRLAEIYAKKRRAA